MSAIFHREGQRAAIKHQKDIFHFEAQSGAIWALLFPVTRSEIRPIADDSEPTVIPHTISFEYET